MQVVKTRPEVQAHTFVDRIAHRSSVTERKAVSGFHTGLGRSGAGEVEHRLCRRQGSGLRFALNPHSQRHTISSNVRLKGLPSFLHRQLCKRRHHEGNYIHQGWMTRSRIRENEANA